MFLPSVGGWARTHSLQQEDEASFIDSRVTGEKGGTGCRLESKNQQGFGHLMVGPHCTCPWRAPLVAAEDLNFEMSEGRRPRLSQRPCEVSVGREAREQIDSLMVPFIVLSSSFLKSGCIFQQGQSGG